MKDYKAAWEYFKLDISNAVRRFGEEDDGLPSTTVDIIVSTLEGMLDKMHVMDNCTDAEIQVMIETYKDTEKEDVDGSYH